MRRLVIVLWSFVVGCAPSKSEPPAAPIVQPANGDVEPQTPLIPLETFFSDPEVSGADLSPDGRFVAFVRPYQGRYNIYVKARDQAFADARRLTASSEGVDGFFWSRDGRSILFVMDEGGNENYHVWSVRPDAPPESATGVPKATDLTPIPNTRALIAAVPKDRKETIIVGIYDRDPEVPDYYEIDLRDLSRKKIYTNEAKLPSITFDDRGEPRLALRPNPDGTTELLRIGKRGKLHPIYRFTAAETVYPIAFHPDGKRVYMGSNRGASVDLERLLLLDPATGEETVVESDPEGRVDLSGVLLHPQTGELMATFYLDDRVRTIPRTEQTKALWPRIEAALPDADVWITSATDDFSTLLLGAHRDVDPGSYYVFDSKTGELELLYRQRPDLPSEQLSEMQPIRYRARDGLEIPAYLTLPKGRSPGKLPLIVYVHGGPWARDEWGYDSTVQLFANRGYAVLQPNFRGSTGYGKAFKAAADRTWGTGAAQHDISDGVAHLVERGIVDPKRVCITGASYGGYATLAGLVFTPELYACGIDYVGPSSLVTLIESFPDYWRPLLAASWFVSFGDPAKPEDRRDLEARSPLFHVDRIEDPLMVVHGANDPRVKKAEADRIVAALLERKIETEYLVAPDEGHGFAREINKLALHRAMELFFAEHLGGRVQPSVSQEVEDHLAKLRVDPKSLAGAR